MSTSAKKPAARYARLMGNLWRNPKVRRLSNEALGVLVRAWSYAADEMTDGRVPVDMLEMWARPKRWASVRAELTARHPEADGSRGEPFISIADGALDAQAHDFTDHNISAEGWRAQKAAVLARVHKLRGKDAQPTEAGAVTSALVTPPVTDSVTRYTDAGNAAVTACSLDEGRRTKDEGDRSEEGSSRRSDPAAKSVFDEWVKVTHRTGQTEFSPARRKRIEWALKTYGLDDTMTALVGLTRSDWNMGRDPKSGGTKYDDLTLVLRNAEQFEKFRSLGSAPAGSKFGASRTSGWQAPADASAFTATAITPDLFRKEAH